eukprot:TRINITY_DN1745_c0_g1_i6.p1 TRINITY_DN1745_c0_g1~~TRINITY_DN1745_c0_g1_i6.p1  ORF type:complete len:367 (-),score=129.46 TRINITY_DN1745_c0_g1_i6:173-1273(-)
MAALVQPATFCNERASLEAFETGRMKIGRYGGRVSLSAGNGGLRSYRISCTSSTPAVFRCTDGKATAFGSKISSSDARRWRWLSSASAEAPAETVKEEVSSAEGDAEEPAASSPSPSWPADIVGRLKAAIQNEDEGEATAVEVELQLAEAEKEQLQRQVATLTEENNLAKERFLRLNADFDNFRKRSEKEKSAMATTVRGEVVEALLPMIDNFERAKDAIKAETEAEKKIDTSYQSIYKQFVEVLKGLGVTAVATAGLEFDPMVHEAIMREESTEIAEGFVVQEFRKGFKIGEKLLRAAMVKVSAGPGPAAAPPPPSAAAAASSQMRLGNVVPSHCCSLLVINVDCHLDMMNALCFSKDHSYNLGQ